MRVPVTREQLINWWEAEFRTVTTEVMLTTAQMESGIGEGLYDAAAFRYEQALHERAKMAALPGWLITLLNKLKLNPKEKRWYCSTGPFQIMGFNRPQLAELYEQMTWETATAAEVKDYVLSHMEDYDRFMARLEKGQDLRSAFRSYNGSGPAAEAYAEQAMAIYRNLQT